MRRGSNLTLHCEPTLTPKCAKADVDSQRGRAPIFSCQGGIGLPTAVTINVAEVKMKGELDGNVFQFTPADKAEKVWFPFKAQK
jgi:hypothetical protein